MGQNPLFSKSLLPNSEGRLSNTSVLLFTGENFHVKMKVTFPKQFLKIKFSFLAELWVGQCLRYLYFIRMSCFEVS